MEKNKLIKELSIGVASLALVAPLVLGGMQSSPVHAETNAQFYADVKKSEASITPEAKKEDQEQGDALQNTEDKNEIKLVKDDPGEAYIDAQDLGTLSPAVRKVVKVVYPRDVKKSLVPQLNGRYLHRRHTRKHGRRYRSRTKKHVKYGTVINKRGDEAMPTADQDYHHAMKHSKSYGNAYQFTSSLMKHSKSYRDAENHDTYEQNISAIEEMPSNPGVAQSILVDKSNGSKVNLKVLRFARYWKYVDEMDGAYNSPDGAPNPKYANHKYTYKRMPKSLKAVDHYVRTNKRYRAVMRRLDKVTVGQELDDIPNGDPTVIQGYISDAKKGLHVNPKVLTKAKYWKHREQADGQWYNPSAVPNKRYAWGRNLKHGRRNIHAKKHVVRHHHVRKHTNKKRVHHKSHKATNKVR